MKKMIELLLNKTLLSIDNIANRDNTIKELIFTTTDGEKFRMYHEQDCCESVTLNDVEGDLNDLIGTPILQSEESTNSEDNLGQEGMNSFTWTFYKLATIKGYVTLRWLGESNGYYSEAMIFAAINEDN